MVQIGNIPAIVDVKRRFAELEQRGLVKSWALAYENVLTRLNAALFFLEPTSEEALAQIWSALGEVPGLEYQHNAQRDLSELPWQVRFDAPPGVQVQ